MQLGAPPSHSLWGRVDYMVAKYIYTDMLSIAVGQVFSSTWGH